MPKKFFKCIVKGCPTVGKHIRKTNGMIPTPCHSVKMSWLEKIGRMDLFDKPEKVAHSHICSKHFKDRAYTSTLRHRLIKAAEPELFLPNPNSEEDGEPRTVHIPSDVPEEWQPTRFALRSNLNPWELDQAEGSDPQLLVDDPSMTKDDMAMLAVAIVYSSSSDDDEEERENSSSNDCQIMETEELDARLAKSIPASMTPELASFLKLTPRTRRTAKLHASKLVNSSAKKEIITSKKNNSKSKSKEIPNSDGEVKCSLGNCIHSEYIKKLEKCLTERSIEIQKLTIQNIHLRRKNKEMTKILSEQQKQ